MLTTACSVCSAYAFGEGRTALFELGCMLNHSCDANIRYSSTTRDGRGCFVAQRDIRSGESLCTNYLGEYPRPT